MKFSLNFIKKEFLEHFRTSKFTILGVLFLLFGIMNPAIAKLTPWLMETLSDSLAESGMTVTAVNVTALDSWVQFFKNIPMALIAFVLIESSIFTKEYQSGTLILSLTKGLSRSSVVISKAIMLFCLWSIGYFLCFGITYGYNAYFWDNAIAKNLVFSVLCWWIFGIFAISLIILFSVVSKSNTGVLLGVGGISFIAFVLSMLPKINKLSPAFLTDGNSLIYGKLKPESYIPSLIITLIISASAFALSIPILNKKEL